MAKQTHKITSADDITPVQEIVQRLVGLLCWRVKQSYGDEFVLDIGDAAPNPIPRRRRDIVEGHFTVRTRGTDYTIYKGRETWVNLDQVLEESFVESDAIMKWMTHILSGLRIVGAEITYPDLALRLAFENDISFVVKHEKGEPSYGVADWEIHILRSAYLTVGPKMKWRLETYKKK